MPGFVDRVAAEALQVRPLRLLLTVLTVPFIVLGWVVGFLIVAGLFAVGALRVGIADVQGRVAPSVGSD